MKMNRILLDPETGGGGGGTATAWNDTIPADIKEHPSLKDFKDVGSLAKSWVNAQALIGAEKIAKPQAGWKPEQWEAYYNQIGRPDTHDKYDFKGVPVPEGVTIDDTKMAATKAALHGAGLTQAQASKVLEYYFGVIGSEAKAQSSQEQTTRETGLAALKGEYGDNFNSKLDVAKAVISKFASPELQSKLDQAKWGNDPAFIRLFVQMGEAMMDDSARGQGSGLLVTSATQAVQEIGQLKMDKDFMSALTTRDHPGHGAAVDRWSALHAAGYQQKKV